MILGGDCTIEFPAQALPGHIFWPFRLLLGSKSRLLGAAASRRLETGVQAAASMINQSSAGDGLDSAASNYTTERFMKRKLTTRAVIVLDDMTDGEDEDEDGTGDSGDISEDGWLLK